MSSPQSQISKRDLGAYYTHKSLTDVLTSWAITEADDTVLEPSFGECGFLRSAKERFQELGSEDPAHQIYGCDIDPAAFDHIAGIFERPVDLSRFHDGDFLCLHPPVAWPDRFSAVIGNPPYLPYRKIPAETRNVALERLRLRGCDLDLRSSLWTYFVALSVDYTRPGGRMAWVLPSSFLHANYSERLRHYLSSTFNLTHAFELKDRQFLQEGTEEQTVILLAKDKQESSTMNLDSADDIPLTRCASVGDLVKEIKGWESGQLNSGSTCGTSVSDEIDDTEKRLLQSLNELSECHLLGDVLNVRIGIVTGNNKFFVLSRNSVLDEGLDESHFIPILSKFKHAPGLEYSNDDHQETLGQGSRGILISTQDLDRSDKNVRRYFGRYTEERVKACSTFRKRALWHAPDDGNPPDAFLSVMHHLGPRLVLNTNDIACTNTVHRAFFKPGISVNRRRLIALSLLSTFSQVSAEIEGRSYGAGVLKHEPREAERIRVLLPKLHHKTIGACFSRVDALLRAGEVERARTTIDTIILGHLRPCTLKDDRELLDRTLIAMRTHRHR